MKSQKNSLLFKLQKNQIIVLLQKLAKKNKTSKNMCEKMCWKSVKLCCQNIAKPSPRWGHSSCVIGDQIIIFGGYANSVYMNDMWCFNASTMKFQEIKTSGQIPKQRSNSTMNYDVKNNRLFVFGGGGPNKTRFNDIHILNWITKQWIPVFIAEYEDSPQERTYHSAQIMYPYLIIFGGEGAVTDLNDLWFLNIQTLQWKQITFKVGLPRPCSRRFHSTCVIGCQFFVIAGCYSKYKPLSSVFSIDLTKLQQSNEISDLQWKQIVLNQQSFLTRWGQSVAVNNNNIYIFGGRFINDLNDLLVIDSSTKKLKILKISSESIPKPRRKSVLASIGNCLIMFGGFNLEYFNDLYYINISENLQKTLCYSHHISIKNWINSKQLSNIQIKLKNGKTFCFHKRTLLQHFKNQNDLQKFIKQINNKQNQQTFTQVFLNLSKKNNINNKYHKYLVNLLQYKLAKSFQFMQNTESLKKKENYFENNFDSSSQIYNNNNYENSIEQKNDIFSDFEETNDENTFKDITIKIGKQFQIQSNKALLIKNNKLLKNILSHEFKNDEQNSFEISIDLITDNLMAFKIIINYIESSHFFVPKYFHYQDFIELYKVADYFLLLEGKTMILNQIYLLISEKTVNKIFSFATQYRLKDLAIACCRFNLLKNTSILICQRNNKYMMASYEQNKFEIKQNMMKKKQQPLTSKKNQFNCSDGEDDRNNLEKY